MIFFAHFAYIFAMMNSKQYTFCEMTKKTVVNVADGRTLGNVCDMAFGSNGGVIGFVVPGKKSFFKSITSSETIFIPWNRIVKIGSDTVLVSLAMMPQGAPPYHGACTFEQKEEPPVQDTSIQQTIYHDTD